MNKGLLLLSLDCAACISVVLAVAVSRFNSASTYSKFGFVTVGLFEANSSNRLERDTVLLSL